MAELEAHDRIGLGRIAPMGFVRGGFVIGDRRIASIGLFLFLLGVIFGGGRAVVKYQVPGPFNHESAGFCDFHNGLYYPTQALVQGISPYGQEFSEKFPVDRQIPFFSPGFLALHAPLVALPLRPAEYLYFAIIVGFALAIAVLTAAMIGLPRRLDAILLIAGAIVLSRGGHTTLYDGYFTFEIILATLLAVYWGERRPWLAAIALMVVSAKPTYILPLGFLMLARGNYKALLIGALYSIAAAAIPFGWLSYCEGNGDLVAGFSQIVDQIVGSQEIHMLVRDESPIYTWTRLDALAIFCKWWESDPNQTIHLAVMLIVLAVPMYILAKRRRLGIDDGAGGMTGMLIMTAFLVSLYHQSYDALVLIAPLAGVVAGRLAAWKALGARRRLWLTLLILVPVYNYFSTRVVLGRLSLDSTTVKVMTSISGVSLILLLVIVCWLASRQSVEGSELATPA